MRELSHATRKENQLAKKKTELSEDKKIPEHVAIIMDGNGRWAKKRFLPRSAGHSAGSRTVEQICDDAWSLGIKYLTVYAFSTENWKRPESEVATLMDLLRKYMKNCLERSRKNNMRVRVIGDITRLDEDLRESIKELTHESSANTGLCFTVALNYGGRDEIVRAVRKILEDRDTGKITAADISEDVISGYLDTSDMPDPDLVIRTSGEIRLSNFLPWQSAYSELYFTDVLWPDFDKKELIKAIEWYNGRDRRYGG
ncbi:MAG: isoprenyl transferase [Lachnospiraceae bacterium]|nr:isoprenyl transferase [Lachnospiraceae bacterium]